jgi:CDP-paratose 2-epimerase
VLITGGAGFIGSNLAERLAEQGENVLIYDSLARPGVEANLSWLRARHPRRIASVTADVRDAAAVADAVRQSQAVFHFAAQVAVTTSMDDPRHDMQVNLLGTFNLLEALRRHPLPLVFASTNKVYGELEDVMLICAPSGYRPVDAGLAQHGISEQRRLDFRTPYGCSKGAADQYVLDYARQFGVPAAVLRMSCIYGPRQLGTEDQGWVAHFALRALAGEPITIYGDGKQVRDVLHVDDALRAYLAAWRGIGKICGQAFNLGGGPANAISLLTLIRSFADELGMRPNIRFAPWRPNDQRWFVADARRVRAVLNLPPPIGWRAGATSLLRALAGAHQVQPRRASA